MMITRTVSRTVFSVVLALVGQAMAAEAQPAIGVDAVEHDFGQLRAGERIEHRFKVTNTGTAELKITDVKTNCGCTVAGDYPRSLAPGASGEIPLALNTANMNGPFNKGATVFSNDPTRPQFALVLKGEARPLIALQPAGVNFGSIYGEKPQTQTIAITNNTEAPLKLVLDPLSSTGGWTFDLAEKESGKRFELTATFDPKGLKPGYARQSALLLSNMQAQHQIQVQANAAVRDRIEAEPSTLMIYPPASQPAYMQAAMQDTANRPATASQPAVIPRTIRVQNYGDRPVRVTEASSDNSALGVAVRELVAGKSYMLAVSVPRDFTPAADEGITIKTDDADKPVIRVPLVVAQPPQPVRPVSPGAQAAGQAQPPGQRPQTPSVQQSERRPQQTAAVLQMAGKDAPAFSLTTLEGKTVSKQDLSGAVTVLNFFAPNCGYCKKQMPRVEALRQTYEAKGVKFLNVSETFGPQPFTRDAVIARLAEFGVKAQAAIDENNAIGRQFSVGSFPTLFVLNKTGKIEAVNMGNAADLEAKLKSQLDRLIAIN